MNFVKKIEIFSVEWLKPPKRNFSDFLIAGVPKLPHNCHQKNEC